jgi:inosine/xanthosine triphosphate pyrophosphatase family protein
MELVLTFYDPQTTITFSEIGIIDGHIAEKGKENPSYSPGFPFRAVFVVDKFNKYYDDLTPPEHEEVNHRFIALKALLPKIENFFATIRA